jgi:hypothetical protein
MRDFPELPLDGRINNRVAVSMQVCPDGRISVKVFSPLGVFHHRAAPPHNHPRLFPQPVAHLREGVPYILLIQLPELIRHVQRHTCLKAQGQPRIGKIAASGLQFT